MTHDPSSCCAEHGRAMVRAGAGLPAIEPGMPEPAGTGHSRRSFLLRSAGLALAVYSAGGIGRLAGLEAGVAQAQAGPAGTVLLSVFLDGGADGLSILSPVGDPSYRRLRPTLGLADGEGTPYAEDPRLHWHPAAASLAQLHAEGKLGVLPAIGYANADQSHFTSRHFWEVGGLQAGLRTGWMGRLLDRVGSADNPLQGVALGGQLSPVLAAGRNPVAAIDKPEELGYWVPGAWGPAGDGAVGAFTSLGRAHLGSRDPALAQAAKAASFSGAVSAAVAPLGHNGKPTYAPAAAYPETTDRFPQRLAGFAAMLAAGLPIRCATVTAPGAYDTHANQAESLPGNLKLTADSLLAFQRDLEARGLADRVLTLVWSEFGRRAAENGSGTDHGAAGIGFVMGSRAAGRMIGEFPGLDRLDDHGNLRATTDFRGVYASLAADWFGVDPASILPDLGGIARPAVIR